MIRALTLAAVLLVTAPVANVRVVDGDTFELDGEMIRVLETDTPESFRSRCPHERELALIAKDALAAYLATGVIELDRRYTDRYGRSVASVYVDGVNVGEQMITDGTALRWHPGKQAKAARLAAWCP